MRSRMSRGVSEWLRGKYLYMGSHILGSGKRCSFSVLYHEASRRFRSGSKVQKWLAWAEGRRPGLIGLGAPSPQKPMWLGKGEKKEGVLVGIGLELESKSSPLG